MPKSFSSCLPITLCLILLSTTGINSSPAATVDKVLGTVDKEPVTLSDYVVFAKSLGILVDKETVDEKLLRKLMEERVIVHEAKRKGFETSDAEVDKAISEVKKEGGLSQQDFENELVKEGITLAIYRTLMKDKMTALKLIEAEVDSKIVVTNKEMEEAYGTQRDDYVVSAAHADVRAIFLRLGEGATATEITDLKRKSLRIASQLKDGESFDALVAKYSDEPLKGKGGKLGDFKKGTLISPLDKKAFSMKPGEISDPVWVRDGVYILKVAERTGETFRPLDEVKGEIRKRLYAQHKDRIFSEWIRVLWEKASISVN